MAAERYGVIHMAGDIHPEGLTDVNGRKVLLEGEGSYPPKNSVPGGEEMRDKTAHWADGCVR